MKPRTSVRGFIYFGSLYIAYCNYYEPTTGITMAFRKKQNLLDIYDLYMINGFRPNRGRFRWKKQS